MEQETPTKTSGPHATGPATSPPPPQYPTSQPAPEPNHALLAGPPPPQYQGPEPTERVVELELRVLDGVATPEERAEYAAWRAESEPYERAFGEAWVAWFRQERGGGCSHAP